MEVIKVFIRTENNYDRDLASHLVALDPNVAMDGCDGLFKDGHELESLTKQSFKEESDINTIVRRFGLTGELPSDLRVPLNGDFTEIPDFRGAMELIVQARESFMELPAAVRARFHNDPAEFVDFCSDSKNYDEAVKLGVAMDRNAPARAAKAALDARVKAEVEYQDALAAARPAPQVKP